MTRFLPAAAFVLVALAGCKTETAAIPGPMPVIPDDAIGHYCQMLVADHAGPKAQIFLKGMAEPLWFAQVADARAYLSDPERDREVVAVYVNDMGRAESWALPGPQSWIAAEKARYVIDSARMGGMGVPEAVPFGSDDGARALVAQAGGEVVDWDAIPDDYVHPGSDMNMGAGE